MRRLTTLAAALAVATTTFAAAPRAETVEARLSSSGGGAAAAIAVTNANRRAAGLRDLRTDAALMRAAERQAAHLRRLGRLTHSGAGGEGVLRRVTSEGFRACLAAENIALGPWDGSGVAVQWLRSAGHRTNALGPRFTRVGAARAGSAWVMVFADPC
ncbi:MAG: CAP domain-containing protein [Hasllibacter sp.]